MGQEMLRPVGFLEVLVFVFLLLLVVVVPRVSSVEFSEVEDKGSSRGSSGKHGAWHHAAKLCPATSSTNFLVDGLFRYPLDVFEPHLLVKIQKRIKALEQSMEGSAQSASELLKHKLYNCTSERGKIFNVPDLAHPKHICAPFLTGYCPLIIENVLDVGKRSEDWLYNASIPQSEATILQHIPALLHPWQTMSNPNEEVRVFIIGGSSPQGAESNGCYCDIRYEAKCEVFEHEQFKRSHRQEFEDCRWGNVFLRWLQSVSNAKIVPVFLTVGGTTPSLGAGRFQSLMAGRAPLNHRDIVLIDYSMNDALAFFKPELVQLLEEDWEMLLRLMFLRYSKQGPRLPTIIIMESFPYAGYSSLRPNIDFIPEVDIARSYTKIASHYRLPILSFRDVIWSNSSMELQGDIHKELFSREHPFWYQHLFLADLYAAWFQREFQRAADFSQLVHSLDKHSKLNGELIKRVLDPENGETIAIPSPMRDKSTNDQLCDITTKHLLDLRATDFVSTYKPMDDRKAIGNYSVLTKGSNMTSADSWKVYSDSKNKFGWIDEFTSSPTSPKSADVLHNMENLLLFAIDDPQDALSKHKHLVSIEYLRTYANAGRGNWFLCGDETPDDVFNNLDAFWETRVSLSQLRPKTINSFSEERCAKQRTELAMAYGVHESLLPRRFVAIRHFPTDYFCFDDKSTADCKRTRRQKLKILSVRVCKVSS